MPIINVQYVGGALPGQPATQPPQNPVASLIVGGPRIPIVIALHSTILKQLSLQGVVPPAVVTGAALIDTGLVLRASTSTLRRSLERRLSTT